MSVVIPFPIRERVELMKARDIETGGQIWLLDYVGPHLDGAPIRFNVGDYFDLDEALTAGRAWMREGVNFVWAAGSGP